MAPATAALALCITFPILAVLSVIGRFWSRSLTKASFAADDWLILPAMILSVGNAANVLWGAISLNLGKHAPMTPEGVIIPGPGVRNLNLVGYISQLVVTTSITLARVSILLFYLRIFRSRKFRFWAIILGILDLLWGVIFFFLFVFQCTPINAFWRLERGSPLRKCINSTFNNPYAVSSILLDVATLCMPWPMVLRLQLKLRQKLAVLGIFMLGGVVVAVSIGKAYAFFTTFQILRTTKDYTYHQAPLLYWTVPECCLSVVCACLPTMRPLFVHMSPESVFDSVRNFLSLPSFMTGSRDQNLGDEGFKDFERYATRLGSNTEAPGNDSTTRLGKTRNSMGRNGLDPYDDGKMFQSVVGVEGVEMDRLGVPTQWGLETGAKRL